MKKDDITFSTKEVLAVVLVTTIFGILLGSFISGGEKFGTTNKKTTTDIQKVYNNIVNNYYKKIDEEKLVESAINGMFNYLGDDYSTYMNTSETNDFDIEVEGEYEGLGISIYRNDDGKIIIGEVYDNSPAKKAGIKANDELISVDDMKADDYATAEFVNYIKTKDKVTVITRRSDTEEKYVIEKAKIEIPTVTSDRFDDIGYIDISVFSANTYKQFDKELKKLEKKGIKSLIIDVRDNPGGHLSEVNSILSDFIKKDKVLYQIEIKGKKKKYYSKNKKGKNLKVAVLINNASASASEVLASSFKESYGATIVGTNSFGKDTIQEVYDLTDNTKVKYTTKRWLTPKGKSVKETGVEPNISVEIKETQDVALEKAKEILK